jgi:hypothetical protein
MSKRTNVKTTIYSIGLVIRHALGLTLGLSFWLYRPIISNGNTRNPFV